MEQLYALQGQGRALPPVGVGGQVGHTVILAEHIRAGTDGDGVGFRAGLDDRDVQAAGQGGRVLGQADDHRAVPGGDGGDAAQALPVAGRGAGAVQGGGHVLGRKRRAVGEHDAGTQGDGPGAGIIVVGVGVRQHGLGPEFLVQGEKALVQQLAHRLLHQVGGGQRVEGLAGNVGQGEGGQRLGLGLLVLLTVELGQLVQRVGAVQVLTAGEGQQERGQQQRQ